MQLKSLSFSSKNFLISDFFLKQNTQDILLFYLNEVEAQKAYKEILFFTNYSSDILYFPDLDISPYENVSPDPKILLDRMNVLKSLFSITSKKILITNIKNIFYKLPPYNYISKSILTLSCKQYFLFSNLIEYLIYNGFIRTSIALNPGEFTVKGELIDVALSNNIGYRINFSWNRIDSIKEFDLITQISKQFCKEVTLFPVSEFVLNYETIESFKKKFQDFFKKKYMDSPIYNALSLGKKYLGYENFMFFFHSMHSNLVDFLYKPKIIYDNFILNEVKKISNECSNIYNSLKINSSGLLIPEELFFSFQEIAFYLKNDFSEDCSFIDFQKSNPITELVSLKPIFYINSKSVLEEVLELSDSNNIILIIFCKTENQLDATKNFLISCSREFYEIECFKNAKPKIINIIISTIESSFYTKKYFFILFDDLFPSYKAFTSNNKSTNFNLKKILIELQNFNVGDLVVHKDHGIGQFLGIEVISLMDQPHDFLKLLYLNNDKLYVPVENINLVKKYGNNQVELSKLGSVNWQKNKLRLKKHLTDIANELLEISANRKIVKVDPIEFDIEEYKKFCNDFQYTETEDQLKAISDVLYDLRSDYLMDRVICGDVGFGKTEVAIRASFIVTKAYNYLENPQVVIIVPTTILCKQHYNRFMERFKKYNINVVQLSSLLEKKQTSIIKEEISSGTANVIIGTHALLNKNIKFYNLRLLIIDEEHHFGVKQKEYLKALKSNIHVISLSATPIPRTLQMSILGIKDFSIITTPPINRLEVKTIILPFDELIIREALLKEKSRGGRSFYVAPRIDDLSDIETYLKRKVPELKYKVLHGQMISTQIEKAIEEFYNSKFDILVTTTIIESGIDIADANTMIVHRSDLMGLSQLYQLRGRIGRSEKKGYAYLTVKNDKTLTEKSMIRLKIIQNSSAFGSGFIIATHDMDLRGFGNLVGKEQSGHIKEVGFELYQEMLDNEIERIKNNFSENNSIDPVVNLGISILIPNAYISDSELKLNLYRRIGILESADDINNFKNEIEDRFGIIPESFMNLLEIVYIKQICKKLCIRKLDFKKNGILISFNPNDKIIQLVHKLVLKCPEDIKLKPDNSLFYSIKETCSKETIKLTLDFLSILQSLL